MTVVTRVEVLSAGFISPDGELTVATLVISPTAEGFTTIVTCAPAPTASDPRAQLTVPLPSPQAPWLGVAEITVTPFGSMSVRVIEGAGEGPLLTMERV